MLVIVIMGAAEARALWQRRARSRCFVCHQHHQQQQQHSSSSSSSSSRNTEKSSFFSSGDYSDDNNTKWWLKGSTNGGFDEEIVRNSLFQDTKCKKLQEFVDLTEQEEQEEEEDYNGFRSKKAESMTPWWRTDKDQLALFVATKSFGGNINIQNCDLPPPMKLRCTSNGAIGKGFKAAPNRFERKNMSPTMSCSSSPRSCELGKGELLEALRHSQTRAREAEEAAREALAEKERVIAILLRQAGQMLAYKHWLRLLEMEMMIKEEEEEEEDMEIKGMNMKKRKKKKKIKKIEIGRYVMAFALGFSLIGAGLFLGWTVGWFFTF